MKFSIAKEHKDFFEKEGWIEFEEIVTDAQINQFNQAIDQALNKRLNRKLDKVSQEEIFAAGRDLSREHDALRKLVTQPRLAEIASSLVEKKPLRLGYDQLLPAFTPSLFHDLEPQSYEKFINLAGNLEAVSSVNNVAAGVIICLGPKSDEEPLLFNKGHVVFFNPQAPLALVRLKSHPGQRYLLIVYTEKVSNYILQPEDPHTHDLKKLDYVFNDKLSDKTHPIVHR